MEKEIKKAIKILKKGGIMIYPTDTIWGIGCDATNQKAVKKLCKIKQRYYKNFIILLDDKNKIGLYVNEPSEIAIDFITTIDNPLTIIYPGAKNLPKNVIGSDGSIAIRIVKNDFCKKLITSFGKPIVSSSPNLSGKDTPLTFNNISSEIIKQVDYVYPFDQNEIIKIKESTIIKFKNGYEFDVIRN